MPPEPRKRAASGAPKPAGQRDAKLFALLSLGCFLAGLLLLWLLIAKAEMLVRLGLEGKLYYLVLLPLGLAVAGFLFGVLRSFALYRGKVLGGVLELGGPVVAFGLVVLGGFQLPPPPDSFAVTVFVHGEKGVQDVPLRNQGKVVIDLGSRRSEEAIGGRGEAVFSEIPSKFRGQEVPVWVDAKGFEMVDSNVRKRLDGSSLYLAVKRQAVTVHGRVQDKEDAEPIAGARIRVREIATTSDAAGLFSFEVPGNLVKEDLTLSISAPGYKTRNERLYPGSTDPVVQLTKNTR